MKSSVQQRLMVGLLVMISCVNFLHAAETVKTPSEKKTSGKEYTSLGRYRLVNMAMDVEGERLRTRKAPARQLESTPAPVRLVAPRPQRSGLLSVSEVVLDGLIRDNLVPQAPASSSSSSSTPSFVVHLPLSFSPAPAPVSLPLSAQSPASAPVAQGDYRDVPTWGSLIYPS